MVLRILPLLFLLAVCAACTQPPEATPAPATKLRVVATIPPVAGIVRPLLVEAKLEHDLVTLVPPGASEHGFEIPPEKLAALAKADVVVMVGLGLEPQVDKFLKDHPRKERRVVVLADAAGIKADEHAGHDHHHGHDHDHDHHHHAADPHVWLDPVLVGKSLDAFVRVLAPRREAPEWEQVIRARGRVADRIEAVHAAYESALKRAPRKTIVVAHDAYGYLAKRYGLQVVAIAGLSAGEPRPEDLKRAAATVKEKGLTTIFVEPQLGSGAADRLAKATGANTRVLDPLGDGDWFALMEKNLAALKEALGVKDEAPKKP